MKSRLATSIDSMLFSRMATAFTMHTSASWNDEARKPVNVAPRTQRDPESVRATNESQPESARSH